MSDNFPENALPGDIRVLKGREAEPPPTIRAIAAVDNPALGENLSLRLGGLAGTKDLFTVFDRYATGEVIEAFKRPGSDYNVLILDDTPDAAELARGIEKLDPKVVKILLRGLNAKELPAEEAEAFDLFLKKQFTSDEVKEIITQIRKKIKEKHLNAEGENSKAA